MHRKMYPRGATSTGKTSRDTYHLKGIQQSHPWNGSENRNVKAIACLLKSALFTRQL